MSQAQTIEDVIPLLRECDLYDLDVINVTITVQGRAEVLLSLDSFGEWEQAADLLELRGLTESSATGSAGEEWTFVSGRRYDQVVVRSNWRTRPEPALEADAPEAA